MSKGILWGGSPAEEGDGAFSRLVIQIAQKGLKLLEQSLVPPLAYRSKESPVALHLQVDTGKSKIRIVIVPEGEGIALKMTLLDGSRDMLAGRRIFLRQHGRAIFSARTDKDGVLQMPRLEPGTYEVTCPAIQVSFQLEFRS